MEGYTTEEQQVEALKAWWKKNGSTVVVAVVVLIGGVLGGQLWQQNKLAQAEQASADYGQVLQALKSNDQEVLLSRAEQVKADHTGSLYASLTALALAKHAVENSNLDQAQSELEWALANSEQSYLQHTARLRLAQVLLAKGQHDAALTLLDAPSDEFSTAYNELKGDIYLAQGYPVKARAAYAAALESNKGSAQSAELLRMKRDDLAVGNEQPASETVKEDA